MRNNILNQTQKEILDEFWGKDSIIDRIKTSINIPNDIKILYLLKALNQGCDSFNHSLDLLYDSTKHQNVEEAIEFLTFLKRTNDFCFDNDMLNGEYGLKKTQQFFFHATGPFNPIEAKETVQNLVRSAILEFCRPLSREDKINLIKKIEERILIEPFLTGQPKWRQHKRFDFLPLSQRMASTSVPPTQDHIGITDFSPDLDAQHIEEIKILKEQLCGINPDIPIVRLYQYLTLLGVPLKQVPKSKIHSDSPPPIPKPSSSRFFNTTAKASMYGATIGLCIGIGASIGLVCSQLLPHAIVGTVSPIGAIVIISALSCIIFAALFAGIHQLMQSKARATTHP